jgi:hypothetical protein
MAPFNRAALLSLALLTGCGAMHVQATVTSASAPVVASEAPRGGPARRLAGASVSMFCPQVIKANGASLLGRTDANGELDFEEHPGGRWIHDGCDLLVEMPGFETSRFPVADVCKEYSTNHCVRAVVTAELVPLSVAAPHSPAAKPAP